MMNVEKLKRYHVYGEDDFHGTIVNEDAGGEFIKYIDLRDMLIKNGMVKKQGFNSFITSIEKTYNSNDIVFILYLLHHSGYNNSDLKEIADLMAKRKKAT